jgi:hypothetical protein
MNKAIQLQPLTNFWERKILNSPNIATLYMSAKNQTHTTTRAPILISFLGVNLLTPRSQEEQAQTRLISEDLALSKNPEATLEICGSLVETNWVADKSCFLFKGHLTLQKTKSMNSLLSELLTLPIIN